MEQRLGRQSKTRVTPGDGLQATLFRVLTDRQDPINTISRTINLIEGPPSTASY